MLGPTPPHAPPRFSYFDGSALPPVPQPPPPQPQIAPEDAEGAAWAVHHKDNDSVLVGPTRYIPRDPTREDDEDDDVDGVTPAPVEVQHRTVVTLAQRVDLNAAPRRATVECGAFGFEGHHYRPQQPPSSTAPATATGLILSPPLRPTAIPLTHDANGGAIARLRGWRDHNELSLFGPGRGGGATQAYADALASASPMPPLQGELDAAFEGWDKVRAGTRLCPRWMSTSVSGCDTELPHHSKVASRGGPLATLTISTVLIRGVAFSCRDEDGHECLLLVQPRSPCPLSRLLLVGGAWINHAYVEAVLTTPASSQQQRVSAAACVVRTSATGWRVMHHSADWTERDRLPAATCREMLAVLLHAAYRMSTIEISGVPLLPNTVLVARDAADRIAVLPVGGDLSHLIDWTLLPTGCSTGHLPCCVPSKNTTTAVQVASPSDDVAAVCTFALERAAFWVTSPTDALPSRLQHVLDAHLAGEGTGVVLMKMHDAFREAPRQLRSLLLAANGQQPMSSPHS